MNVSGRREEEVIASTNSSLDDMASLLDLVVKPERYEHVRQVFGSTITGSSLTSVGTLVSGTWNASTIGVPYGGTGTTSLTSGYLLISITMIGPAMFF